MLPYDLVKSKYNFPPNINDRDFQIEIVNDLAPRERAGYYAEVGTGKTFMSTVSALFKQMTEGRKTLVAMPPILAEGWLRWLRKIEGVTVLDYRGTPKYRKTLNLEHDFIVMSMDIFKNDYDWLLNYLGNDPLTLIVDEATCIKNIESANYRYMKQTGDEFGAHIMLLTATPLDTPGDGYAYVKTLAPTVYRSHKQFEMIHVGKKDFFGKVTQWQELDVLKENMKINSARVLSRDVLNYPEPIYDPMFYDLAPEHQNLYRAIVDEQLDLLPNEAAVDGITEGRIYSMLHQVVWNYPYFSDDPKARSKPYELLDEIVNQLGCKKRGGKKLMIFANYKMTMQAIKDHLGGGNIGILNSQYTASQKQKFITNFIEDPDCNILQIHPLSGGKGLDGLQHVCHNLFFAETPPSGLSFTQCVGRAVRDGQNEAVIIRLGIANKTVQVKLHRDLLVKDEQAGFVQGSHQSLRSALYGDEI